MTPKPTRPGSALARAVQEGMAVNRNLGRPSQIIEDALTAAADMTPPNQGEQPWVAILSCEDPEPLSGADIRVMEPGCFTWMQPPLTAHVMTAIAGGHDAAEVAARLTDIKRVEPDAARLLFPDVEIRDTVTAVLLGRGWFDGGTVGQEAARLVTAETLRRVSVQAREVIEEFECTETEEDEWGEWCVAGVLHFLRYEVSGFTILDTPGVEAGTIRAATQADFDTFDVLPDLGMGVMDDGEAGDDDLVMTAASMPVLPSRYFQDPKLTSYQRVTISEPDADGWVHLFGHVAPHKADDLTQCHIDYPDECRLAPVSPSGYEARFLTGIGVRLDDGTVLSPGRVTMGGPHAPLFRNGRVVGATEAALAYSDADQTVAYVNAGDDEHGWWIAGVIRPDLTPERLLQFASSPISGDWRVIGNELEAIAVHAVNVPGFNPPRPQVASVGEQVVGMVAAGQAPRCPKGLDRLARVERKLDQLLASSLPPEIVVVDDATIEQARLARIGRTIGR